MSSKARIILCVLCGLMILAAPWVISSPAMLGEVREQLDAEDGEELNLSRLLFSGACAEEAGEDDLIEEEVTEAEGAFGAPVYELPLDFSVPPAPKAENYTDDSYTDETIRVTLEEREADGVIWHLAFVQIASPTQLRTATAVPDKLSSKKMASVSGMAKYNHAVVAINGDNYQGETAKKTFEYRMTQKIRSKTNQQKDMLIIDENGDFHLVLASAKKEQQAALESLAKEYTIVNAFTFGPALVINGAEQEISKEYGYNPNGKEPRAAIGQIGHLSYVLAIAEGRGESSGVGQQALAHYMAELGCRQAFNLDGGNSAEMTFGSQIYKGMPGGDERGLSDIIYFATAVPEE